MPEIKATYSINGEVVASASFLTREEATHYLLSHAIEFKEYGIGHVFNGESGYCDERTFSWVRWNGPGAATREIARFKTEII